MSKEEFIKQIQIATSTVEQWPKWKQNILSDSSNPTLPVPRAPVDNQRHETNENSPR